MSGAHSGADSYVLTPDGVIQYVDFNYPGRLPLAYLSSSSNITGWINFMRHVAGEDWEYATLGHANVGYKADITRTFEYISDLYDAFFETVGPMWWGGDPFSFVKPEDNSAVMWGNLLEMGSEQMAAAVFDKWKEVPQVEAARSHAYKVMEDVFLNYNHEHDPTVRPDFSTISPDAATDYD